jgi:hypothetical protein
VPHHMLAQDSHGAASYSRVAPVRHVPDACLPYRPEVSTLWHTTTFSSAREYLHLAIKSMAYRRKVAGSRRDEMN